MNFIKFPERGYSEPALTYYIPLIDINVSSETNISLFNKLELWDLEPFQVGQQKPKWTWSIGENAKSIIQPCNSNWKLRLTKDGKIIKDDKIKYFDRNEEIEVGPFLYIKSIK